MGQQQLLLVILVTIIVGIATVVAINTFGSAADNANVDAVRQDLTSMAASAQSYYMKPGMMGGGDNSFAGISFSDMAVSCEETSSGGATEPIKTCTNQNGKYTIDDDTGPLKISGTAAQAGGTITASITKDNVSGLGDYTSSGS